MTILDFVRSHLWSGPCRGPQEALAFQERAYERAVWLVRVFYVAGLIWVLRGTSSWLNLLQVDAAAPQWPARWLESVGLDRGVPILLIGYLVSALAAASFPQLRVTRFAYFLFFLQYLALENGFGKINHSMHAWLWVSGILVLLRNGGWHAPRNSDQRKHLLGVIVTCQLLVLMFYSLTGIWKAYYSIEALFLPEDVSSLQFEGFSLILANRLMQTDQATVIGDFVVRNPILGWALYNGTIYLESVSVLIAFRPRLHRSWGFGLILFHIGTQLAMGFTFLPNILLLGMLLVASPIAPETVSVWAALSDLPGIHWVVRQSRRRALRQSTAPTAPPSETKPPSVDVREEALPRIN